MGGPTQGHSELRICTLVYGERHLGWLKRTSVCLTWPRNRKALDGALWRIYTTKDSEARAREILAPIGLELEVEIVTPAGSGECLNQCLANEVRLSVGTSLLIAPPDMIFGEGTIETMARLDGCVTVPHPRVVAETFPELTEPTSNARLVSLTMEHMHDSFRVDFSASTGFAWREIGPKLYGVTAKIPTPHFVRPRVEDLEYLKNPGDWDHVWPEFLVKEQRQRIVGSSDAAFMVELTPARHHRRFPQEAQFNREHHKVNSNVVTIWRAE